MTTLFGCFSWWFRLSALTDIWACDEDNGKLTLEHVQCQSDSYSFNIKNVAF